ncbi:MAG TPA: GTP-binding protein, partial [Pirellulales bacterium]
MAKSLTDIRNLGVIAHIDAGKTTVTERMLYYAKMTHRPGDVDKGTTTTDFDPEEQQRGITIYGAAVTFPWHGKQYNLIDTPGHVDFTAEVERALRVLDGAVVVFSAREGVEAQSETVWRQADKYNVPRIAFVNKMDREGANFKAVLDQMKARLHAKPVVIVAPIGVGPPHIANPFRGTIDLVTMEELTFDKADKGMTIHRKPVPDDLLEEADEWRREMLDELSNHSDELLSLLLEEAPVSPEMIRDVLRKATIAGEINPVLCGSALDYIGIQPVLDAVTLYLPSPAERPPVVGRAPAAHGGKKGGKRKATDEETPLVEETRKPDPNEPFCGLVFKINAEKHGDLYFVRVYSGSLPANSRVTNPRTNEKENVSQLWRIFADRKEQVSDVSAGDIIGVIGLRHSVTGDTICDVKSPIVLESITFPETVISMAIEPDSSAERKKLADVLEMLKRQDPTFRAQPNEDTGQTLISGMGELHLEIIVDRLRREYGVDANIGAPQVAYRETITK